MINKEKDQMLSIINRYRHNEEYRKFINSSEFSDLSKIEQIALKDMLITNDGDEILKIDLSNHYDDYNSINIDSEEAIRITCMNMAVANLLHLAFQENNISKFSDFNLEDIKTRVKGDLYSTLDKPIIIRFINFYNNSHPDFLPKKAKEFMDIYYGHIKNGIGTGTFSTLAQTYNTNIYLSELMITQEKKNFWRRK